MSFIVYIPPELICQIQKHLTYVELSRMMCTCTVFTLNVLSKTNIRIRQCSIYGSTVEKSWNDKSEILPCEHIACHKYLLSKCTPNQLSETLKHSIIFKTAYVKSRLHILDYLFSICGKKVTRYVLRKTDYLVESAFLNNVEVVEYILSKSMQVTPTGYDTARLLSKHDYSIFVYAMSKNHVAVFKCLLKYAQASGILEQVLALNESILLRLAYRKGHSELLDYLLTYNVDIATHIEDALVTCVKRNDVNTLRVLVDNPSVDTSSLYNAPLRESLQSIYPPMLDYILSTVTPYVYRVRSKGLSRKTIQSML